MDFFSILGDVLGTAVAADVNETKSTLEDLFGTPENPMQTVDPSTGTVEVQEPEPPSPFNLQIGTSSTSTTSTSSETGAKERAELLDIMEHNAMTQRVVQKMTAGLEFNYTDFMPGGTRRALRL